jgi:ADP-ribose pyrophosphatase YjhB (NUDIX family)
VNYCPKCGAKLGTKLEGGRERIACSECSYIFFGDFSIGVGGVVIRDGKALLIRRGVEPFAGWWQIPGGYAEHDEEIEQAVEREVFEESGVRARALRVLGIRNSLGKPGTGQPSTNVYVIFLMEPLEGEAQMDGGESTGADFFSIDEIEGMEKAQNLSKWAIRAALADSSGLEKVDDPTLRRPGYVLFGVKRD